MASYDPQTCYNNLIGGGFHPCPSDQGTGLNYHCGAVADSYHAWCIAHDIYTPISWNEAYNTSLCGPNDYHDDNPSICDPHVFASYNAMNQWIKSQPNPAIWDVRACMCCCACYAYGTQIAISETETKTVELFFAGDKVLAGSMSITKDEKISLTWDKATVVYSMGSGPMASGEHAVNDVVLISYGKGQEIICTPDQIFLLSNGKLKYAQQLNLIDNTLTAPDGSPLKINSITRMKYKGGIHHISTNSKPTKNANGNLLNSNGVVTGDYSLQISASGLGDLLETGPHIGSEEYDEMHKDYIKGVFHYSKDDEDKETSGSLRDDLQFYVKNNNLIPPAAKKFVEEDQAFEIDAYAHFRAPLDPVNYSTVRTLFKMFNAFYTDIHFYLDETDTTPNAYAFEAFGEKQVVISGKIIRVDTLFWQGIALILAQAVASFGQYEKKPGMISRSEADLYSTKFILRTVFPFQQEDVYTQAMPQIKTLFSYVKKHAGGNPKHPKNFPSLDCRLQTFAAGQYGGDLPECAGGPVVPIPFMVYWAQYDPATAAVTIAFNLDIDAETVTDVNNYTFTPAIEVTSAKLDSNQKQIVLSCTLAAASLYLVSVNGIKSVNGEDITTDGNNYARFTTPN
jgi:hypothetical protein